MAPSNRAALINQALKVAKKHFKPVAVSKERTLLEHVLFACCVENSHYEPADRVFRALVVEYYDWNEVRVSTIRELADVLRPLNDPEEAATRLKRMLQSVFETFYSYDLEGLKKQNIGQAVKQIEGFNGSTPFVVAFVTQNALGGHSIAVNRGLLECFRVAGIVSDAEAVKGTVPGLERAVPKSKGADAGSMLHQMGVEMARNPLGQTIRKLLLEIDPSCKDRLPKRAPQKSDLDAPSESGSAATETHDARHAAAKKSADKSTKAPKSTEPVESNVKETKRNDKKTVGKSAAEDKSTEQKKAPAPNPAQAASKASSDKKTTKGQKKEAKKASKEVAKKKASSGKQPTAKKKQDASAGKPITRRKPR